MPGRLSVGKTFDNGEGAKQVDNQVCPRLVRVQTRGRRTLASTSHRPAHRQTRFPRQCVIRRLMIKEQNLHAPLADRHQGADQAPSFNYKTRLITWELSDMPPFQKHPDRTSTNRDTKTTGIYCTAIYSMPPIQVNTRRAQLLHCFGPHALLVQTKWTREFSMKSKPPVSMWDPGCA